MILEDNTVKKNGFHLLPSQGNCEVELERKEIEYESFCQKFVCENKVFKRQFAHIYAGRLNKMKESLVHACSAKWGNDYPICRLSELSDDDTSKCIVIGTLYKHQKLKPSIVKEVSEENQILPQPTRFNYVSESDLLILEDEIQRIRLLGSFDTNKLITGVVVALLGFKNDMGKFEVEDMCFTGVSSRPEKPLPEDDSYIVMISGLNVGAAENTMALELLVSWIKGELGSISDQETCAKVCRVLIAGNSIKSSNSHSSSNEPEEGLDTTLAALKQLDNILVELAQTVEVDLMPGEFDLSNHALPQQPIYGCIFPQASEYESLHMATNPYECNLGGRRILGTSGQPVTDIKSFTNITSGLDILENTLVWGHLAPTAPDTLACYPYYNEEPFIITERPDVYFAGNQPCLQTKLWNSNGQATRLICIPDFSESKTCVILNLKTLECIPLTFTI